MSRMTIWRGSTASPTTLDDAVLYAPLTHTAVPTRGSITPTFTRATTETGQKWDEAGYLDFTALAGEMVFKGARRVRNALQNASIPSEDFSVAAWAASGVKTVTANYAEAPSGEMTADRVVIDTGGYLRANTNLGSSSNSKTWLGSVYIKATSGTQTFRILLTQNGVVNNYSSDLVATSEWQRFSFAVPFTAGGSGFLCGIADKVAGGGTDLVVWGYQAEDVTGQTTQTASEYVSVGVESAPAYHGSMVDGVKCYDTDRSGNPITTTTTYDAVTLNGVAGTYVSTPDSVANSIAGSKTAVFDVSLTTVTPVDYSLFFDKASGGNGVFFGIDAGSGKLVFFNDADGALRLSSVTLASAGITANTRLKLAATQDAATGTIKYYYNLGAGWLQLGADVAGVAGDTIDLTLNVGFGARAATGGFPLAGKIYSGKLYSGVVTDLDAGTGGTLAVDFDASRYAGGTTLTGSAGETWTLQGNAVIHPTNYPLVGYVPWEARTNLCLQSQSFDTTWAATALTTISSTRTAPDGTATAFEFDDGVSGGTSHRRFQSPVNTTAVPHTMSVYAKDVDRGWIGFRLTDSGGVNRLCWFNIAAGVVGTAAAGFTTSIQSLPNGWYRCIATLTTFAGDSTPLLFLAPSDGVDVYVGSNKRAQLWGAQVELGSSATPYIPTTTLAVARNADVDQYPTTAGPIAAAGSISLDFTPYHAPSGTIALWGTYVDASNYTAILHDATNLIFRKRIAGVNYDATIANAFTSGTTYKMAASWGVGGSTIYLNGVAGTPHANTTAAQIAATMQFGANGNSLQQPGAAVIKNYIWQRQLSGSEQAAITA